MHENSPGPLGQMLNVATLFATSIGIPFEKVLADTQLQADALMDLEQRVQDEDLLRIFLLLDKVVLGRNAALLFAREAPTSFLGRLAKLICRAPDLASALQATAKFGQLWSAAFDIRFQPSEDKATLLFRHPLDDRDTGFGGEMSLGLAHRLLSEHFGEDLLLGVTFRHSPRSSLDEYQRQFGVPLQFDQLDNALHFSNTALADRNRSSTALSPVAFQHALHTLAKELAANRHDPLADIRHAIEQNANQNLYSVKDLASRLATSDRHLQRRLRDHGTTASELINEVRQHRVCDDLANTRLNMESIAENHGFGSERGFRRAFESWCGMTPAQARRELRKG